MSKLRAKHNELLLNLWSVQVCVACASSNDSDVVQRRVSQCNSNTLTKNSTSILAGLRDRRTIANLNPLSLACEVHLDIESKVSTGSNVAGGAYFSHEYPECYRYIPNLFIARIPQQSGRSDCIILFLWLGRKGLRHRSAFVCEDGLCQMSDHHGRHDRLDPESVFAITLFHRNLRPCHLVTHFSSQNV